MEQKIDENDDGFGDRFGRNRTKTVEICMERGVNCTVACRMGWSHGMIAWDDRIDLNIL